MKRYQLIPYTPPTTGPTTPYTTTEPLPELSSAARAARVHTQQKEALIDPTLSPEARILMYHKLLRQLQTMLSSLPPLPEVPAASSPPPPPPSSPSKILGMSERFQRKAQDTLAFLVQHLPIDWHTRQFLHPTTKIPLGSVDDTVTGMVVPNSKLGDDINPSLLALLPRLPRVIVQNRRVKSPPPGTPPRERKRVAARRTSEPARKKGRLLFV